MKMQKSKTILQFIANYPEKTQLILNKLKSAIKKSAPNATEKISYGIPTFFLNGNLVHFSAYEKHIGFYPGSEAIVVFKEELKKYETSKGTVKFPIDKPLPISLITKIVRYRVKKNEGKKK